jgi:hypothetical protein
MVGKTLDLEDIIVKDQLGCAIADKWVEWNTLRATKIQAWKEIRQYLYATDTTQTSNQKLPWKNKTTIPKLTQISDNLYANYMASMFPKRKSIDWFADHKDANSMAKREAILSYMQWTMTQPQFKEEMSKCVQDFIHYGNAFGMAEWIDQRVERDDKIQTGFVGPTPRRISPLDIVFNPTAPSFIETPKIVRSLISVGELMKKLDSMSTEETREAYQELKRYFTDYRANAKQSGSELHVQDSYFQMDGFTSFRAYLDSDYAEILTFYGDLYDYEKDELLQNHVIMVVDRHKVIHKEPNASFFGYPPIFHVGWRPRQDNLWAMGPLDNLVGMQYRLDHVENLKSDVFDLIAYPVLNIKGYVNDFEWGPMQRIVTDQEGDVEMLAPPFQILQVNNEIQYLVGMMEEMAGAPKEAMGFRTPGEKTAHEVQRMENAASRIFQTKIKYFEEQFSERMYNAMLEMGRRNMVGPQDITVMDDEFNIQVFMTLTPDDITGAGKIKPLAARHFAEKAETIQNITNLYASGIAQDPMVLNHISSVQMVKLLEDALDLSDYELFKPNVRIAEQAEAQRLSHAMEEQTLMQAGTPTGLTEDDAPGPGVMPAETGPQPPQ